MAQVVILGAGLTGLSAAYTLEKNNIHDYLLFEKDKVIGGLCKTERRNGFIFDYTGHFLHATDPAVLVFLEETIGKDSLAAIARQSAIYSEGLYTAYPYQSNLYGLSTKTVADCMEGFVLKKAPKNLPKDSFASWVLRYFGQGFADHFFFPYQEKLLCHPVTTITSSWTGRFVPSTSLEQIIEGALKPSDKAIGYNAHFHYPKAGGIDHLINAIAKKLHQQAITEYETERIDLKKRIVYFTNGHQESFEYLISTMPLNQLLSQIEGNRNRYKQAASHLQCNYLLNINVCIKRPHIISHHWIYFPESKYQFFRIGVPHLLTPAMAKNGHSSLAIEIAYRNRPASIQEAIDRSYVHLAEIFGITKDEVIDEVILHLPYAYVLYDHWRDTHLQPLIESLYNKQIFSTGRYGGWKYASMQEAILDGQQAASSIINCQKRSLI
jgi:protoporphyrinogen oxidase